MQLFVALELYKANITMKMKWTIVVVAIAESMMRMMLGIWKVDTAIVVVGECN